ncbi:hypothetical protein ACUW9V_002417 [Staphylococcus epidermidis]
MMLSMTHLKIIVKDSIYDLTNPRLFYKSGVFVAI